MLTVRDFPLPRKTSFWPPSLFTTPYIVPPYEPPVFPRLISTTHTPTFSEWESSIRALSFDKVVLARKTTFTFDAPISPGALYHLLKKRSPNAFVFCIPYQGTYFLGASPEKLFSLDGLQLTTEALAGTGTGKKEEREFLFVKDTLSQQLQKISHPFSITQDFFIKEAGNVSHLHYPFSVTLKQPMSHDALISYLHPTPAIGGLPREEALSFIYDHESFDRGWYAGTVAYENTVYVGIRSCFLEGNSMHVFVGAGITSDSDPAAEWEELNQKQRLYERL